MIDGSIVPHLEPIMTPASGVNPIDVSIHLPSNTAESDAPLPK